MFNFSDRFQELRSTVVALILLLASIIMGIVWIAIGVSRWLSECLGEVWGPIVLGLICFVPVVIFALVKVFGRGSAPRSMGVSGNEFADPAAANMTGLFEKLSGHSPFLGVVAAVVTTFLINRYPTILPLFAQLLSAYIDDVKMRAAKAAAGKSETPCDPTP